MQRPALRAALLAIALSVAHQAASEPFVVEDMPANMDSVIHPRAQAQQPGGGGLQWRRAAVLERQVPVPIGA